MKKGITYIVFIAVTFFACQKEAAKPSPVISSKAKIGVLSKGTAVKDVELDKLMHSITDLPTSAQVDAIRRYSDQKKPATVKNNARMQPGSLSDDYPGLEEY